MLGMIEFFGVISLKELKPTYKEISNNWKLL